MAKFKFKEGYKTHATVLNDVFNKKNAEGEPYKQAYNAVWEIVSGKKIWFPYIAVIDKKTGAWKQPNVKIDWINIPSQDERAITQIPLATDEKNAPKPNPDDVYAVFGCTDPNGGDEKYRFYGIYSCAQHENGICIWERKSLELNTEEWKAEE